MTLLGVLVVAVFLGAWWVLVRSRRREHEQEYARYIRELDDRAADRRRQHYPRTDSTGPS